MSKSKDVYNIICQYEPKIKHFFQSKLINQDDIDDLVQEVLFQIIKSISKFRRKSRLSTWIYSICRNTLYHYYYQKKKSGKLFHKLTDHYMSEDFERIDITLITEKLAKPLSTIYDLYYKKNYKIKEIAKLMDKPEGTIKYLLYTLRLKIKEYLL